MTTTPAPTDVDMLDLDAIRKLAHTAQDWAEYGHPNDPNWNGARLLIEGVFLLLDELAKTRAELARLRATSGCPSCAANACDEHIHLSSAHIGDLTRELADAHLLLKLIRSTLVAATSGKRVSISLEEVAARITDFVDPEANPATTAEPAAKQPITARWPRIPGNDTVALHDCGGDPKCCGTPGDHDEDEPADEPKATCHLPVQNGEPCGLLTCRKHGCRVAPTAETAAS